MLAPPWINPAFRLVEAGRTYQWNDIADLAKRLHPGMPVGGLPVGGRVAVGGRSVATLLATLVAAERGSAELVMLRGVAPRPAGATALVEADGRLTRLGPGVVITTEFSVLLPTSGTTGEPKLARHNLTRLIGFIRGAAGRNARWLQTYEPSAYGGLQVVLSAVASGATLVVEPDPTPEQLIDHIASGEITHVSAYANFWRMALLKLKGPQPALKAVTVGGEIADQPLLDRLAETFPNARIRHLYASTEAGVMFSVGDGKAGFPAAWLNDGVSGIELRIRGGVLETRCPRAMLDYAGGEIRPYTHDGWLITGDLVEVHGDRIMFIGREDGQFTVGGVKVAPEKVEQLLLAVPGVHEAGVMAARDPATGFSLVAAVVAAPGVDPETIRARIAEATATLTPAEQLHGIEFVERVPLAPSGKKSRFRQSFPSF